MGNIYGYIRVSSTEQNEDRQIQALKKAPLTMDDIFMDKISGKDFHRPQYRAMLRRLKAGDLVCVTSIDRLGRNYEEIQRQWRTLTKERWISWCSTCPCSTPGATRTCSAPSSPTSCFRCFPSPPRTKGRTYADARPKALPPPGKKASASADRPSPCRRNFPPRSGCGRKEKSRWPTPQDPAAWRSLPSVTGLRGK